MSARHRLAASLAVLLGAVSTYAQRGAEPANVLTGPAAFISSVTVKAGTLRKITVADLPKPFATQYATTTQRVVPRPEGAWPQAPPGFQVGLYASGLDRPRLIRVAPNGDVFVMESRAGQIRVLRGLTPDGKAGEQSIFATGLRLGYGMVFYPGGDNPQWLYVGNTDSVVRFAYQRGDLKARSEPETVIASLPAAGQRDDVQLALRQMPPPDHGHWTRDLAFSLDGKQLFVAVGSASNNDDPDTHPAEKNRATILEYRPDGTFVRTYATGLRNATGIAVSPTTGQLWASVNERDGLGDELVPDFITHVEPGGFYGWPFYYIGGNPDPGHAGKHLELKDKVLVPDVLLPSHTASLQLEFYTGTQFPPDYRGSIFAGQNGSWNRSMHSGYEVVRVVVKDGRATGVFQDFLTGFLTPEGNVWGKPVGVGVAKDGVARRVRRWILIDLEGELHGQVGSRVRSPLRQSDAARAMTSLRAGRRRSVCDLRRLTYCRPTARAMLIRPFPQNGSCPDSR